MSYRVIQWATGGVGRAALRAIADHPELELAGCWVHSDEKVGRDAGELCGIKTLGIKAQHQLSLFLEMDADCVVYSPLLPDREEIVALLASGKNVVTPLGWFYPFRSGDIGTIEEACRKGGSTLHGTGIHPGGITERFPLMVSALSRAVRHVRAEEFSDIRSYNAPFVVGEIMLFGKTPEQARSSPMLDLLGNGFNQSIDMVAASLGLELDEQRVSIHEIALATAPIDSPIGVIEPGTVAAQRFTWQGLAGGDAVITARVNWLMGEQHLDPPWSAGPAGERFEIEISGTPPVQLTFKGLQPDTPEQGLTENPGIAATANHCVNAVPYVCRAEAGIKTYLDLPLVTGRAATDLKERHG